MYKGYFNDVKNSSTANTLAEKLPDRETLERGIDSVRKEAAGPLEAIKEELRQRPLPVIGGAVFILLFIFWSLGHGV